MDIRNITDWYIPETRPHAASIYPGNVRLSSEEERETADKLLREAVVAYQAEGPDYRVTLDGMSYRGHRQRTVEGWQHILRRITTTIPDIKSLGLPPEIRQLLTSQALGDGGGLVLVCGMPGHGKSTTCAAAIYDRVRAQGSFCLAVEDPPEFPLHGDIPAVGGKTGKIVQVPADEQTFAADMRDAMRCYPANVRGSMLLVGETRDAATAAQVVRAALDGRLVFTTLHASSTIAAIERILSLAKGVMYQEEAVGQLAHALRAVVHQTLDSGKLSASALFSMTSDSPVAARIKAGNLQMLSTEVEAQATLLKTGQLYQRLTQRQPK